MIVTEKRLNNRKLLEASPSGYIYYYTDNTAFLSAIKAPDLLTLKSKITLTTNSTVLFNLRLNIFKMIKLVGKITACIQSDSDFFLITVHIEYIKLHDLKKLQRRLARYESLIINNRTKAEQKYRQLVCGTLISCSTWEVQIKDLGLKGVRIAATEKIGVTNVVQLMFLLPTMEYVVVYGKIVWDKGLYKDVYEYGIQFTKFDKTAREKIKEYLQAG